MTQCASCRIRLGPDNVTCDGQLYCCVGCVAGGPCVCTYEQDLGRYPPAFYARPISLSELLDRYEKGFPMKVQPSEAPDWLQNGRRHRLK
jgi:hypothetical protein